MTTDVLLSRWEQELEIFSNVKTQLVLEGNILDMFRFPWDGSAVAKGAVVPMNSFLHHYYRDILKYDQLIFFDQLTGFHNQIEPACCDRFAQMLNLTPADNAIPASFRAGRTGSAGAIIRQALAQREQSTVIVLNFASRLISNPSRLEQCETDSFLHLLYAGQEASDVMKDGVSRKNLCIMVVNKTTDMPPWFFQQNPHVKTITVSTPSMTERADFIRSAFPTFFSRTVYAEDAPYFTEHPHELGRLQERFVALTDGLMLTQINDIRRLCKAEGTRMKALCDVVSLYKNGIRDDLWQKLDPVAFSNSLSLLEKRVKGQKPALQQTVDIIKRAITGLNGLQHSSLSRPKGILFFAGPTGVGKTETAKALAELIFGDESACIRFDMSEYSLPHADQKLMGAPPGYVGYEAGGQLTNAIRRNPFSILLFDEIEKAHPSVLDKFLQILEDGRLTDGQGNTVYFSESLIIFTSNLGITVTDQQGIRHPNVTPETAYPDIEDKIKREIGDFFRYTLGRPEILNRIGENIVVFDFIRPEVAASILDRQLERIATTIAENNHVRITIDPQVRSFLLNQLDLNNGGRGIGSVVERFLLNPLARCLFAQPGVQEIYIHEILLNDGLADLAISI